MRNVNTIQFTYAEVREALNEKYPFLDLKGIKYAEGTGYIVQSCPAKEEPPSAASPTQDQTSKDAG